MNKIPAFIVCAVLVFWTPAVFAFDTADITLNELLKAANSVDSSGEFLDEDPNFLIEETEEAKKDEIISVADPLYYWNW